MLSSIKSRLVFLYSATMLTVLIAISIIMFFALKRVVYKPVDATLMSKAKILDRLIKTNSFKISFFDLNGNRFSFSFSDNSLWIYIARNSKYFFQIRSPKGETLEKSPSLGEMSLPFKGKKNSFTTVCLNGKFLRVANYYDRDIGIVIQVAYNIKRERRMLMGFISIVFGAIATIMIISTIGGYLVSRRALRPLDELSRAIKNISNENLNQQINLPDIPEELKGLVDSFNDMLTRLNRAFEQQKRFISDLSHELKTPISVILMQSELILKRERNPDEYRKALQTIQSTASVMSELIEKMLLVASLNSKYAALHLEECTLGEIIEKSLSILSPEITRREVIINNSCREEIKLMCDKTAMLEVMINLIDNAIKYNRPSGSVSIECSIKDERVIIKVKDTGKGIEKEKLEHIFEAFFRADASRSKSINRGFGLGLSIVKKIVELHKGTIDIESTPGKGTTVTVILPHKPQNSTMNLDFSQNK